MKDKQDKINKIQKTIEKTLEKYYFSYNTEETRKAIVNEIKFLLENGDLANEISDIDIESDKGDISVTLK